MPKWQAKKKTIPPPETPQEKQSPNNSENTVAETEETLRLLTGAMLTQASCTQQFATLLGLAALSNSATPRTVAALLFALSEMVSLTTNMCDQARALTSTLQRLRETLPSDVYIEATIEAIYALLTCIIDDFEL
jgi:hypothetical protein